MKCLGMFRLFEDKYLAVLDGALAVVTVDKEGNPIKWVIWEDESGEGSEPKKELVDRLVSLTDGKGEKR